jgi:carbonic anhydrase
MDTLGQPKIAASAFIHPSAIILGQVNIGEHVFVGPYAVIRADEPNSSIQIGDNCNIQDAVIVHALRDSKVLIGSNTSLSHGCLVHGPCQIGNNCFIGFRSIVFRAQLQDNIFIRHLAVIENVLIPSSKIVESQQLVDDQQKTENLNQLGEDEIQFMNKVIETNCQLIGIYKQ